MLKRMRELVSAPRDDAMLKMLVSCAVVNLRTTIDAPYVKVKRGVAAAIIQQLLGKYQTRAMELKVVLNDLLGGARADALVDAAVMENPLQTKTEAEVRQRLASLTLHAPTLTYS